MLLDCWEVRIVKTVSEVLQMLPDATGLELHAFSISRPVFCYTGLPQAKSVNYIFTFSSPSLRSLLLLSRAYFLRTNREHVTVTVVRDKKNGTALRANKIAGFVTLPKQQHLKHFIVSYVSLTYTRFHVSASFFLEAFMSKVNQILKSRLTWAWRLCVPQKGKKKNVFLAQVAIKHLRFHFAVNITS